MTDTDGDQSSATLTITINGADDAMDAVDDTDSFGEDAVQVTVAGAINVLTNDTEPDLTDKPLAVSDVTAQNVYLLDGSGNLTQTVAGTITFAAGGTYSLSLNADYKAAAQALDDGESFKVGVVYTAINQDSATDDAILRITINGANDGPTISVVGDGHTVYEAGLATGSNAASNSEFASGSFTIGDSDGLDDISSITIGETAFAKGTDFTDLVDLVGKTVDVGYGTVKLMGYSNGEFEYQYTLDVRVDNDDPQAVLDGATDAGYTESFDVTVSDGDLSDTTTVYVDIVDDIIEITSLGTANLSNTVGATAEGTLEIEPGGDGLDSLVFSGTAPTGLKTAGGESVSYHMHADGSLHAIDSVGGDDVFTLTQNAAGDGYSLALDQALKAPVIDTTVSITSATLLAAGAPVNSVIQVDVNGVLINLSATDSSGTDDINPSDGAYGVDNNSVDEGDGDVAIIALDDPAGKFSNMTVTVGNFTNTGNGDDVFSYQLSLDGNPVSGGNGDILATADNDSINTTLTIANVVFDEIRMWATHSGGNINASGSYKIVSINADVTATSSQDIVLGFGVDVMDGDGDIHGGDFQVAVDTNGDSNFLETTSSLDQLIDDGNGVN